MKPFVCLTMLACLTGCAVFDKDAEVARTLKTRCSGTAPNTTDCKIQIVVTPVSDPTVVCTISLAGLDSVTFKIPTGDTKRIVWELSSNEFFFRENGIEFKVPDAPFSDGRPAHEGAYFVVKNKGKKNASGPAEEYAYGIHLARASDKARCGFDPTIRNE